MRMTALSRSMVVLGLCLAMIRPAFAGNPVDDLLVAARKSVQEKSWADVDQFMERALKIAPDADVVIPARTQARIYFFQGIYEWCAGDRNTAALERWRQALMVDSTFPWDAQVYKDDEAESVFESLRREVTSRKTVSVGIPENTRSMKIFVAGSRAGPETRVVEGRYIVQVACSDGTVYGKWLKFGKPPRWETMCPDGFGPEPAVAEGGETGLGLDEDYGLGTTSLAPAPKTTVQPIEKPADEPAATPNEKASEKAAEKPAALPVEKPAGKPAAKPAEKPAAKPAEEPPAKPAEKPAAKPAEKPAAKPAEKPLVAPPASPSAAGSPHVFARPVFFWSGVGLLAVGGGVYFGLANPAWSDVTRHQENAAGITRSDADALTRKYNIYRYSTLGLFGLGIVGVGGGLVAAVPGGVLFTRDF
jgi:hypothetical protein